MLGYTARVKFLLNQGTNPDLLTKRGLVIAQTRHGAAEGNTALIIAAAEGFADICELLIQAGARIDHRSYADNTPLFLAASGGHTKIAFGQS